MATHDYVLANQSGSSFRSDLNNALAAIVSQNSSATEPATTYSYQYWIDTSVTPALIKQRNAANDDGITLGQLDGQLYITGGTAAAPGLSFANDTDTGVQRINADKLALATGGENRLVCDENGRVGIGTQSPNFKLQVEGAARVRDTSGQNSLICETQVDSVNDSEITIRKSRGGTGGPSQITAGDQLGTFRIRGYHATAFADAFSIKSTSTTNTGNFVPDTLFRNDGEDIFTLKGSTGTKFHKQIFSNNSLAQGQNGFDFRVGNNAHKLGRNTVTGNNVLSVFGGSGEFRIKGDGDAQNTNNSYGALSDSKLKENIVDANSQWDDIKAVQVRNYNFKAETNYPTHTQIGVVAQELETISPGLVKDNVDEDGDGNDLGTVTKSVSYSVLYMKALKALQEAMTRIETLETKVAALEAAN